MLFFPFSFIPPPNNCKIFIRPVLNSFVVNGSFTFSVLFALFFPLHLHEAYMM